MGVVRSVIVDGAGKCFDVFKVTVPSVSKNVMYDEPSKMGSFFQA